MEFGSKYGFQHLPNAKLQVFKKVTVVENLNKWSMWDGLRVQVYSFTRPFKGYLDEEFIKEFFACPAVTSTFEILSYTVQEKFKFKTLGMPVETVQFIPVPCSKTTMELVEKLKENDLIARASGGLTFCETEFFDPSKYFDTGSNMTKIELSNNLRKVILLTQIPQMDKEDFVEVDEDLVNPYNSEESSEFLFRIFAHLVIGGSLNQYEDNLIAYLNATKNMYKEFVAVEANNASLFPVSSVYKIISISNSFSLDEQGQPKNLLFQKLELNNFLYLIVNPVKKLAYTMYHHV